MAAPVGAPAAACPPSAAARSPLIRSSHPLLSPPLLPGLVLQATVGDLKRLLVRRTGLPEERQRLIYG